VDLKDALVPAKLAPERAEMVEAAGEQRREPLASLVSRLVELDCQIYVAHFRGAARIGAEDPNLAHPRQVATLATHDAIEETLDAFRSFRALHSASLVSEPSHRYARAVAAASLPVSTVRRGRAAAMMRAITLDARYERGLLTTRRWLRLCAPVLLAAAAVVASVRAAEAPQAAPRGGVEAAAAARALNADLPRRASARSFAVFVALERANRVAVVKGPPWHVVRRIRVPAGPHNLIASPNDAYIAVTSPPAEAVSILDARSGRLIRSVRVGGYPHDVVFGAASRTLWVTAERAARLVELAIPSGRRLRSVPTGGEPHDLDLDPRRDQLWVTIDGSARVELRRASSGTLIARPELGGAPHDVAVAPSRRSVWFSNFSSGELTVVSTQSRRPSARVLAGAEPHHFVFGLGWLWVSDNSGGTLVRIDPGPGGVLGRTAVGPAPHHATIAGERVLVAVHGNGRIAIVSRQGKLLGSLSVGAGPHGIAAVPGD
jgi:DNA-binding beta-propeller fold protein YncE